MQHKNESFPRTMPNRAKKNRLRGRKVMPKTTDGHDGLTDIIEIAILVFKIVKLY